MRRPGVELKRAEHRPLQDRRAGLTRYRNALPSASIDDSLDEYPVAPPSDGGYCGSSLSRVLPSISSMRSLAHQIVIAAAPFSALRALARVSTVAFVEMAAVVTRTFPHRQRRGCGVAMPLPERRRYHGRYCYCCLTSFSSIGESIGRIILKVVPLFSTLVTSMRPP